MLESVGGVAKLLDHVPAERVLYGSYFPFFYWESALLKIRESELNNDQRASIMSTNAERLLARPEAAR
jgi:predicted TIM-barrel fold metal-dependent hydrolase